MLVVKNLKKAYKSGKKIIEAVKGISFEAKNGEVFAMLGPNGAGKTTTIKSILGLVLPDEGEIYVNGVDAIKERKKALRYLSAVLEGNRNIHWRLSVVENLEYFGSLRGLGGKKLKKRIEEVLERLELYDKKDSIAGKISRGQQQRLAIAIAILPDTPILLLDEPTLGLDVESAIEIRKLIKEFANEGKLVLLSTHDMNLVEEVSDRVMVISNGKVVALDKKENLKNMFKRRRYKITLERKPSEKVVKILEDHVKVIENGREFVFEVDLASPTAIYDIFEILKEEKPPIKSIEVEELNFEKIFLKIVRGDGDV